MKITSQLLAAAVSVSLIIGGCKSMTKTQKGAAIGTGGGAAVGAVVGKAAGNTALGAIIGAAVGGVSGALIGKKMDKQAEELKRQVPDAKVERVGEGIVVEFNSNVLFGFNKAEVNLEASQTLDKLITVLNTYPDTNLEIQGHTDNRGTDEYNQGLSVRRATSAANYLRTHGVPSSRVSIKGYGKDAPKYSNETEEGRSGNRRVEFLITANEKMKAEAAKEAGK
ncbi:MAG: OmpA family protein [Chitinophagaceae bacterium]|nr:OmpA family protein [Chitinophagaceae bacterium]